ncbi:hypothetical protein F4805DRAFT_461374 [Annulohypoxylon moriforme]|nr:hypothetical protein F4805DRAFT_461374 [Annulohypoxylon moriforme]
MSTRLDLAVTTNKLSRAYSLTRYLASSPTITETLASSSTTKDPLCIVTNKTQETKKSLEEWQVGWDKMEQYK